MAAGTDFGKLSKEDQLLILEQGIKSDFWQLIQFKWGSFIDLANKSLLSPTYTNRDFLAGKIRGMTDLLQYPEKHIVTLKREFDKQKQTEPF